MEIISRTRWGARYDRGFRAAPLPASEVWLHHSVTLAPDLQWVDADKDGVEDDEERAMRTLEQIGEDRFGGGISYTFAVMPSGRVYEGHGVDRQGAHTGGRNDISRAIVLVGNYDTHRPTAAQIASVAALLREGHGRGWWKRPVLNGGHRQAPGASTACPGRYGMAAIAPINQKAQQAQREDDGMSALDVWRYNNPDKDANPLGKDAYANLTTIYRVTVENQRRINELTAKLDAILKAVQS